MDFCAGYWQFWFFPGVLPYAMRLMSESTHVKCLWKNDMTLTCICTIANQALLNNAIILVKMKQYEQAAQALDAMYIEKCKAKEMKLIYFLRIIIASFEDNEEEIEKAKIRYTGIKDDAGNYPASELVENWIQMNDLEQMTACLEQINLSKKNTQVLLS